MVIVMKRGSSQVEVAAVIEWVESLGFRTHPSVGVERTTIGVVGDESAKEILKNAVLLHGVEQVVPILKPYKLASRESHPSDTVVSIGGANSEVVTIGDGSFTVMAGPCAIESEAQMLEAAYIAKKGGAKVIRGGAYKPRTSPYAFQGKEEDGLKMLAAAREVTGLPIVTEVMDAADVDLIASYVDVLQIGARNMQNFTLLKKVGLWDKPVLLKRGMMSTIEELLMSAEYILAAGNPNIILCERGIRTFETATRNTLDISAVCVLKELTHLPVIVDPSHAVGTWKYVNAMSRASLVTGADGVIVEVHPEPERALCDGPQSLRPEKFYRMMEEIGALESALAAVREQEEAAHAAD